MLPGELAIFNAVKFDTPTGTVLDSHKELRAADPPLFSKKGRGPRSAARMNNSDAVNSILANVVRSKRGENIANVVRATRGLPNDEGVAEFPPRFTSGLTSFLAESAGLALDNILSDFRAGRFALWSAGEGFVLRVTIRTDGAAVFLSLTKPERFALDNRRAVVGFSKPDFRARKPLVERTVTIDGEVFRELAEKLGPPP